MLWNIISGYLVNRIKPPSMDGVVSSASVGKEETKLIKEHESRCDYDAQAALSIVLYLF